MPYALILWNTLDKCTHRREAASQIGCTAIVVTALPGTPDLAFPRLKKIINISGCFWHMHTCGRCRIPRSRRAYWLVKLQRNRARDIRTSRALRRQGWKVLTLWECQLRDPDRLAVRIANFLGNSPKNREK